MIRAITVVHLLTNTRWGAEPPIRFLSCRQSLAQRDRTIGTGDAAIYDSFLVEISSVRESLKSQADNHLDTRRFLKSMRDRKCVVEMRQTSNGIKPCIDLLPSVSSTSFRSVCSLSLVDRAPSLEMNSLMKALVDNGMQLNIEFMGHEGLFMETSTGQLHDVVCKAQVCALDMTIVKSLQEEEMSSCCDEHRLTMIRKSSQQDDYSVSYAFMGNHIANPIGLSVKMSRGPDQAQPIVVTYLRKCLIDIRAGSGQSLTRVLCQFLHDSLI
jgi:hypothetical protein